MYLLLGVVSRTMVVGVDPLILLAQERGRDLVQLVFPCNASLGLLYV
jgi:hypothetical protein